MGFFTTKNTPEGAVKAQIDAKLGYINEKYVEIGRFVKLKLADKVNEPEIKNMIAEIDKTLEELKDLNKQLYTIRGVKLCVNCGHEIPISTAFCPDCGTKQPVPAVQPVSQPAQPVYGNNPVQPGYVPPAANPVESYAKPAAVPAQTSGVPMPEPVIVPSASEIPQPAAEQTAVPVPEPVIAPTSAEPAIAPAQEVVPQPAAEQTEKPADIPAAQFIFCSQCGNKESAEMKFCSNCGSKL